MSFKCVKTGPGSVAEYHQWEVRWAKPIGSSKMLERQRSIEEAVAAARNAHLPPEEQQRLLQEQQQKASYTGGNKRAARKKSKKEQLDMYSIDNSTRFNQNYSPDSPGTQDVMMAHEMSYDYKKILETFVAQNLQSNCRFINEKVFEPPGFVCKVKKK